MLTIAQRSRIVSTHLRASAVDSHGDKLSLAPSTVASIGSPAHNDRLDHGRQTAAAGRYPTGAQHP